MQREKICVFDLGGSTVSPDGPDRKFIPGFRDLIGDWLEDNPSCRVIVVVGGGSVARRWQNASRALSPEPRDESLDWIGIQATRLNAELMRSVLGDLCQDPVVTDPTGNLSFTGSVLVGAGWRPGFSTDYVSVLLAEWARCHSIVMVSNISYVYSEDPRKNPQAQALLQVGWDDYIRMIDSEWKPGGNLPFDPVASRAARNAGVSVGLVSSRNLANIRQFMDGRDFVGSTIGP